MLILHMMEVHDWLRRKRCERRKGDKLEKEEQKRKTVGKGWQITENDCPVFDKPSLKQETIDSTSVERLSSEKAHPIEASKPTERRKRRLMPWQSCCNDAGCGEQQEEMNSEETKIKEPKKQRSRANETAAK